MTIGHSEETEVRDTHVQSMHFSVGSGEGISYRDPEPVSFVNDLGAFDLADGKLTITPNEHFSDEEEARRAIEPFLRAWEIDADLTSNLGMIRFTFERVELIDRDPPPGWSPQVAQPKGVGAVAQLGQVSVHVSCRKYPQPPHAFRATPEAQLAYRRWLGYRSGKEPLQSMAYFVLTLVESIAGDRRKAAPFFKIEAEFLRTIGRLSTTKGDPDTARKARSGVQFQELTGAERQWLEKAIALVIRQLGERASGVPLSPIRLTDLPSP
jgi:hypothetical protein